MYIKFEGNIINSDSIEFIDPYDIKSLSIHFKSWCALEIDFDSNKEMIENLDILHKKLLLCK